MRIPKFAADCPWLPETAVSGMATATQNVAELPTASPDPMTAVVAEGIAPVHAGVKVPLEHAVGEAARPTPIVSDWEKGVVDVGEVSWVIRTESGTSPEFVTVAVPYVVRPGYSAVVDMVSGETERVAVPDLIVTADPVDAFELRRA
jgi:hypothetical protein